MRKKILTFIFLCVMFLNKAQTTYVDIMTAPAMIVYANSLENGQNATKKEMGFIKEKQAWLASQMVVANNIQDKVYKGLTEVNALVSNGLQAKRIYEQLAQMPGNLQAVYKEASDKPEFAIFGVKAGQLVYNKSLEYYTEISQLLTGGNLNMMTSGDRMLLLESLEQKTTMLNFYLINMKYAMMRAKAKGWWRAINPFQDYVSTDKAIFDSILQQASIY